MDYDDIDVTMLDNRDCFGVVETNTPRNPSVPISNSNNSDRFFKKPAAVDYFGVAETNTPRNPPVTISNSNNSDRFFKKPAAVDYFGVAETNTPRNPPVTISNSNNLDRFFKKPAAVERIPVKRESSDSKPMQNKFARRATKNDDDHVESDRFYEKRSESKKAVESVSVDYRYRPAVTFQEKLSVLEDRDRHLRETSNRDKSMNTITHGTCPDMCPERERLLREINCSFSIFEGQIVQNEMHVVPELLVKEYARSSADQEEPLPHELRPEPVLIDTMSHLLMNIIPKIEELNVDVAEWYNFCWDRLRSLRKDIIQQQLCSKKIVELLEQSARFHICCFDLLFDRERGIFDDKINAENLVNCLQMLITMYEDLEALGVRCANECEFRTYMMLLLFDSNDLPGIPKYYDDDSRRQVDEVTDIYFAFKLKLCTKFFKLVKKTHYLNACILQRYFTTIRAHTLNTLVNAYSPGSQAAKFPFTFVQKMLEMDNVDELTSLVGHYGFTVSYEMNEIRGTKSSFTFPETKLTCKSSYLVENKRVPIVEAITRTRDYRAERRSTKVHSSFGEKDILQRAAWSAEDQRAKVVDLYGDIYQTMQHSPSFLSIHEISDDDDFDSGRNESPKTFTISDSSDDASNTAAAIPTNFFAAVPSSSHSLPTPPPPSPLAPAKSFNFGDILSNSQVENVVDADHHISAKLTTPPPLFVPKATTTKAYTITPPSPVIDRDVSPLSVQMADSPTFRSITPITTSNENPEPTIPAKEFVSTARKPDEVVNSLTEAFNQFERVYWDHFGVTESDRLAFQRHQTLKENRKLRRVVKNGLKRINARKAARVWRRKVEQRRERDENFVGVTHLPPQEYFRLWGRVRQGDSNPSLVEEMLDSQSATKWSRSLLNAKACGVRCVGRKLADHLISVFKHHPPSLVEGQLPLVVCWKTMLAISDSEHFSCRSFISKLSEFCRVVFYGSDKNELGTVQSICTTSKRVLVSIDVKTGVVRSEHVSGLSSLTVFVNEQWESSDQFVKRVTGICESLEYTVHVSVIIMGECSYSGNIFALMSELQGERMISGWSETKWKNFLTLPGVVFKACQYPTFVPSAFRVKSLESFVESASNEFFTHLLCVWADRSSSENSPIVFIELYNKFLIRLSETLDKETPTKYNLAAEFLPHVVGCEGARNNLVDLEECSRLMAKCSLISFTKWPPHSVAKMVKLLTRYCAQIEEDRGCGTLLPNVLRLLDVDDESSVDGVNERAPWLKIVELWSRYRLCAVSKNDANNVFIFYDEEKVANVAKGLWIET